MPAATQWVRALRPFFLGPERIVKVGEVIELPRGVVGQLLRAARAVVVDQPTTETEGR